MARAVLFDLDGTLIDTTELILASCAHTFNRHLRHGCPPRAALIATFGRSLPEAVREIAALEDGADADELAARMLETYRAHNAAHHDLLIRSFDGVAAMLDALHQAGVRMGVVTSKREAAARRGLRFFRFEHYFEVAVFHDDTTRHKPDPEPLLRAAERLDVGREALVYVGDSVHDVAAGRAAGIRTVAALWGPSARTDLEAAGPAHFAETPADVLRLLLRP